MTSPLRVQGTPPTAVSPLITFPGGSIPVPGASARQIGARGFTGSRGTDGIIGVNGFVGSRGFDGSIGFAGSQGAGFTGSASSVVGFTGSIGFTGSRGAGFVGSQGITGFVGSAGSTGFTGSQGVGFVGSIGFTGSAGSGGSSIGADLVDAPPTSPSVWDDEFDGVSLNPKWDITTFVTSGMSPIIAVKQGRLVLSAAPTGGLQRQWLVQSAPSGDFRIRTKLYINTAAFASSSPFANNIGVGMICSSLGGSPGYWFGTIRTHTSNINPRLDDITHGVIVGTLSGTGGGGSHDLFNVSIELWIQIRQDSTSMYSDYSTDGITYVNFYSAVKTDQGFSVPFDYIGLFVDNADSTHDVSGSIPYFRVEATSALN